MTIFINGLKANITKDMLIEDNPFKSYTDVIGRTQQSEAIRLRMVKERGERYKSILLTQSHDLYDPRGSCVGSSCDSHNTRGNRDSQGKKSFSLKVSREARRARG